MKLYVLVAALVASTTNALTLNNKKILAESKQSIVSAIAYQFVDQPSYERMPDIKADMTAQDLVAYPLHTPGGHPDVQVYGYPLAQDVHVSGAISRTRSWEPAFNQVMCEKLESAASQGIPANFLDVGANIGVMTLSMAKCAEASKGVVVAVEGMPTIANHLKAGVKANNMDNVLVYPYAVGGPAGQDSLKMAMNPTNKGGSAVAGNKAWTNSSPNVFTVPLTTLDAMMHASPVMKYLSVAKFDIEGNEGLALKGAQDLFSNHPPCTLVIELVGEWLSRAGTPGAEVVSMIHNFGYNTASIPGGAFGVGTYTLDQRDMQRCVARLRTSAAGGMSVEQNLSK